MVDNVAVTPGSGATFAADDIGGVLHPRVKVSIGADGTAADWPVGSGNQSAVPRVTIATDSPGVTALGQTTKSASLPVTIANDQEIAHSGADSGTPAKTGRKAIAALSAQTLVAANDRTNDFADLDGASLVRAQCTLADIVSGNASNTDGTSTEVLAAGAAGIKHYLTTIILTNMHASSTIYVEIKDGTTVKLTLPCPPGGSTFKLPVPLPGTAATAR